MTKRWPILYGKASTGKVKVWTIRAEETKDGTALTITDYSYEGSDQIQSAVVKVGKGKNIGRSNETTPYEQACLEAESKWKKQQDKKYVTDKKLLNKKSLPLPMLALDYKQRGKDITWPALVQPKLNGIRCLARKVSPNVMEYTSRGGKTFTTLDHLTAHLLPIMEVGDILDGEVFTQRLTFQQIVSAVKRLQENTAVLEYWVYDVVRDEDFYARAKHVQSLFERQGPIVQVPTHIVPNEKLMIEMHQRLVGAGYEGTIIRNYLGTYRESHRSKNLQKYKDFIEEEFEIIGGKDGVGKEEGAVTFLCVTEEGKEFKARSRGTYKQRRAWLTDLPNLVRNRKKLTVRYFSRTDENIPYLPVGLAIRDYE